MNAIDKSMINYFETLTAEYSDDEFMQPQIIPGHALSGEEIPADYDDDLPLFWARLSAPGYMDCTDWTAINSNSDIDMFFEVYYM